MEPWTAMDLLSREVEGRGPSTPPQVFGPSNLYQYLDGGAAFYLAYDFCELAVASYPFGAGDGTVVVEIYRMGKSEDAFGVYSDGAEGEHPQVGQNASYGGGLLRFWKGRAFVQILSLSEETGTRERILAIGKEIAARVPEEGNRPRLMHALPADGLVADRATYFHTVASLNHLYYLSDGNPLGLGQQTEAVFAEYEIGGHTPKLLLIRYPSESEAANALKRFEALYLAGRKTGLIESSGVNNRIEILENGLAVGMSREKQLLLLCFEAQPATARSLLNKTAELYRTEFGEHKKEGGKP